MKTCGDCTECCTALAIDENGIRSPRGHTCQHVCATGCAIYQTKPTQCAQYKCDWLSYPQWPERLRPDKCGVIFSTAMIPMQTVGLMVFEIRENAMKDSDELRTMISKATRSMPVFFVYPDKVHILTSSRHKAAAEQFAKVNDEHDYKLTVFDERPTLPGLPQ